MIRGFVQTLHEGTGNQTGRNVQMITQNAMLVNVHISMWEGRRLDRIASRRAVADAGAGDSEALRVSKLLVSKESMEDVVTARNAIRTHFLDNTLPWKDNGDRLLPRTRYMKYVQEHSALVNTFEAQVEEFLNRRYPAEIDRAAFRLGTRFDADDYPRVADLRRRFVVTLDIDAINEPNDFRVKLTDGDVAAIRASIEEGTRQRCHAAMAHVWDRVIKTVEHFAGRMESQTREVGAGQRRSPLHATTLENLRELVEALPDMNIMNDPGLTQVAKDLSQRLCAYDLGTLKGNPETCDAAMREAQDILDGLSGMASAWQTAA